ncbi:MAG TPA: Ig-like domain-containing protein [Duganella sp.]
MLRTKQSLRRAHHLMAACATALLAVALSACGGGSGGASGGCATIDPNRDTSLPGCGTGTGTGTPATGKAAVTLALTDSAGAAVGSVAAERGATVTATLKNANGVAVANALVTFTTTDKTGVFTPATGSAITDAAGKASVGIGAGTVSGAFAVSASASVADVVVSASTAYTVQVPQLTLSAPVLAPTTLAAGGTASLTATVMNGGAPYAPAQSVSFTSPCVANGKARIASPATTVNGVASTSYTDLGCGGVDVVTASIVHNGNPISSSASLTVQSASAGQLVFVSALPQNIALKGSGGAGRQESATITFKVLDRNGNPVAGQAVNFALNTNAGGLTLNPASATTGSGGLVTTTVASGTVNTPVRVTATLAGTTLSTLSDQLVVSTGVPEQNSFSLSAVVKNLEGGQFNGCPAPAGTLVTARLADHFHNPAPDGTAVSFTAEGGSIDASCLTGLASTTLTDGTVITQKGTPGECTVRYCAGNPRPADGRVTVLAYALGEESFVDTNGNNRFDGGETYTDLGEPFRNDRAVTDGNANGADDIWKTGSAARVGGEQYIDSNGDAAWQQNGNGAYNGVLLSTPDVNSGAANTVHVRQAMVMVLSNSTPNVSLLDQSAGGAPVIGTLALNHCTTGTKFVNDARSFHFAIRDNNPTVFAANQRAAHPNDPLWLFDRPGNPLPAGTQIAFSASNGAVLGSTTVVVPNTNAVDSNAWTYTVQMLSDAVQDSALLCTDRSGSGALTITITTPNGVVTTISYPVTD